MGTTTPNLGLYKPDDDEFVDVDTHINAMKDTLDAYFSPAPDNGFFRYIITSGATGLTIDAGGNGLVIDWQNKGTMESQSSLATLSGGVFTLTRAGLWRFICSCRQASSADGVIKILYFTADTGGGEVSVAANSMVQGASATPDIQVSLEKEFPINTAIRAYAFSSAASSVVSTAGQNQRTHISGKWVAPIG